MELTGNISDYFIVFIGGILVSFTPCVYPVLPLTAAFIADANINGSKLRGFLISLVYVLGMAITYSSLAVFAALTGKIFGQVQSSPIIYALISAFLVFFSLVMFEVINMPSLGFSIKFGEKPTHIVGVFSAGMISGLIVGPCIGPVLGSILAYIAYKQNIINGVGLVFVFSYGVGLSLIIVGTFSGILPSLPRSGKWLITIKNICAIVLMLAAIYYLLKALSIIY
ncbi:MAG: sulfite exporter TauE/SafE family protein [Candidatus Omnitrophica bacterium]|nr:sulfite exporter TauE/SafE family protein [Candidatus Omnitrophota bacterium]MBU4334456.1 sulfite exporter TauE/SafE family protein [Candidatus Omnitrophota bacterium]